MLDTEEIAVTPPKRWFSRTDQPSDSSGTASPRAHLADQDAPAPSEPTKAPMSGSFTRSEHRARISSKRALGIDPERQYS